MRSMLMIKRSSVTLIKIDKYFLLNNNCSQIAEDIFLAAKSLWLLTKKTEVCWFCKKHSFKVSFVTKLFYKSYSVVGEFYHVHRICSYQHASTQHLNIVVTQVNLYQSSHSTQTTNFQLCHSQPRQIKNLKIVQTLKNICFQNR